MVSILVDTSTGWPVLTHSWFLSSSESSSWGSWWGWVSWGTSWWAKHLDKVDWLLSLSLDDELVEDVLGIPISVEVDADGRSNQGQVCECFHYKINIILFKFECQ